MVQERQLRAHARAGITLVSLLLIGLQAMPASATVLPIGFVETRVAQDFTGPTAVAIAPDGRIFVAEQSGRVRLIKNGVLLDTPFLQVPADAVWERGLLGITLDPDFAFNHFVYVYYPPVGLGAYRLSRFTADGDVALPVETILAELPPYGFSPFHFGGGLHFAPDGTLYLSVGDHTRSDQSPLLTSVFGKMLRLNADGSIPTDNPFYGSTSGLARSIWARGLRNPFSFDIHPRTGRMFINDVGNAAWDEINEGSPGADYGWPTTEGPTDDPAFVGPTYTYSHFGIYPDQGCAVTGAAFYAPDVPVFPAAYLDGFFFGDFCGRYVRYLDAATDVPVNFAFDLRGDLTDLDVGPDGSLYYLARSSDGDRQDDNGEVYRISYTASLAPQITAHPESQTILLGDPVTFVAAALEATGYQWQRDGVDIPGATTTSFSLPSVALLDAGAEFQLVATNGFGSTASSAAVLNVTTNQAPAATITVDSPRALFFAGDLVQFSGTADDPEDGPLDAAAFTWRVDFHHGTHFHPFFPPTNGISAGEFTTASEGETAPDVWYRINLQVEDSGGRSFATSEDVFPELAMFSLETDPPGLQVTLDGQPRAAPHAVTGVVNLTRRLGVPDPQTLGGMTYQFERWSDAGARQHAIAVPLGPTTYTAFYTLVSTSSSTPSTSTTTTSNTTSTTTTTTTEPTTPTTTSTTASTAPSTTTTTLVPSTTTTTLVPSGDLSGQHPFVGESTGAANTSFLNLDTSLGQVCLAGQVQEIDELSTPPATVTFSYRSTGTITKATGTKIQADFVSVSLTLDISSGYSQTITADCKLKASLRKAGERDSVKLRCELGEDFSAFPDLTAENITSIDNAYARVKKAKATSKNGRLKISHVGEPAEDVGLTCDLGT
jgi:glucose/arabinose dehydrogenase